ncbi:hypothetical protein GCM10020369_71620 [Cryptosporangium minutisporangium]|uniref:Uncharacterized protein n=1 Tax=Cryptosporangium minutisporangium TaxID=113569 RepID=A0ABP6T9D6_9ACTN
MVTSSSQSDYDEVGDSWEMDHVPEGGVERPEMTSEWGAESIPKDQPEITVGISVKNPMGKKIRGTANISGRRAVTCVLTVATYR